MSAMSDRPVNVAVVGLGFMGLTHTQLQAIFGGNAARLLGLEDLVNAEAQRHRGAEQGSV